MLIGAMNNPRNDVLAEIEWMAELGFDFIDLTLEPPAAASWLVNPVAIRGALEQYGLKAIGHTPFYLPLASALEGVRAAAVAELHRCLDVFKEVGVSWMNVHPDRFVPMHDRGFVIRGNLESLRELLPHARAAGIGLMIENLPGEFNSVEQLGELLDPLPELGLHLDIGHANLQVPHNTTRAILEAYGTRLRHVHIHDNKGGNADLHLALGSGSVDIPDAIRALRRCGYDGTFTLEVFTVNRHYLTYSRDLLRHMWREMD